MKEDIPKAQQRLSEKHDFTVSLTVNEMGHLANLAKQMCHSLLDIRIMMIDYQNDCGASNFKRWQEAPLQNTDDVPVVTAEQIGSFDTYLRDCYSRIPKMEPI